MDLVYGKRFKGYKVIKYKVMDKTLIDFENWSKKNLELDQWCFVHDALVEYRKSINDAQAERLNVSENEGKRNICPDCKGKRIVDSKVYIKKTCETCKGKGLIE